MLKIGIVGLGHIGKLHLKTAQNIKKIKISALIDIKPIETEIPVFSSIAECHAAHPDIDMYVIATPNGFHYQQAKEVLELKKSVLVEKPVALHKNEVEELLKISKENNVRLFTSMQLRFSPIISYVKKLYEEGKLGELFLINTECFWNRNENYYKKSDWHGKKETDGGVLFTQFSHFVDILHYLLGRLELINHISENFSHHNSTEFSDSGILQFKAGKTLGSMIYTTSTYEKNFDSSITIIAEKGTLKIGGQYMNQLLYQNIEGTEPIVFDSVQNLHEKLYEDILISVQKNKPSMVEAVYALEMIEFIEKAMKN